MINLFNIENYIVDTTKFKNILHDNICNEFEQNFCEYVGAKYGCLVNSATNAIFLSFLNKNTTVDLPSIIPPVVANAIITSNNKINFIDNIDWVGNSYILHNFNDYKIIDSAQKVEKNQFIKEANNNDIMIFSFYPTKPIGSCDGGIIVSNDLEKIKWFKTATMNGMSMALNNWERVISFAGYKMYMNSIQCFIANENLKKIEQKYEKLNYIRNRYNKEFNKKNTSNHLYTISVPNNKLFLDEMKKQGINCGIHYNALHLNSVYANSVCMELKNSEYYSNTTLSLPFHEKLTDNDIDKILKCLLKIKYENYNENE